MTPKRAVGLALALILSVCPFASERAAAAVPNGRHSCCRTENSKRASKTAAPATGDCCLRAPANPAATLPGPETRRSLAVAVVVKAARVVKRIAVVDCAGRSPPASSPRLCQTSPRSPPLPA